MKKSAGVLAILTTLIITSAQAAPTLPTVWCFPMNYISWRTSMNVYRPTFSGDMFPTSDNKYWVYQSDDGEISNRQFGEAIYSDPRHSHTTLLHDEVTGPACIGTRKITTLDWGQITSSTTEAITNIVVTPQYIHGSYNVTNMNPDGVSMNCLGYSDDFQVILGADNGTVGYTFKLDLRFRIIALAVNSGGSLVDIAYVSPSVVTVGGRQATQGTNGECSIILSVPGSLEPEFFDITPSVSGVSYYRWEFSRLIDAGYQ